MGIFDRFPYSSTHEMNLDFMLGKATEIAEDMQTVATGMAQVQAGLSAISEKTEQATQAAAQAAQSASSIEGSVTAAEEAAEEAQMHNESAQTWANNAMTYKADCQRSATEAAASSVSAAQAATAAAGSEDTVAQYAQAANASAQSAANNNDSAHQYANQASASASNATFHSSNAQTAATNAQTAATNAQTAATRTAALKDDCETLHSMCTTAVDLAGEKAVAAANSAAQAAATKTDVETLVESLPEDFTDLNNTVNQLSDDIDDMGKAVITVGDENGTRPFMPSDGGYITTNGSIGSTVSYTVTANNNFKHIILDCTNKKEIIINGKGWTTARLWCFVDSNDKILVNSTASLTASGLRLLIPNNAAKCIINTFISDLGYVYLINDGVKNDLRSGFDYLNNQIKTNARKKESRNLFDPSGEWNTVNGCRVSFTDDSVTVTTVSAGTYQDAKRAVDVTGVNKITASYGNVDGNGDALFRIVALVNGTWTTITAEIINSKFLVYDVSNYDTIYVQLNITTGTSKQSGTYLTYHNIQVQSGDYLTEYIPHGYYKISSFNDKTAQSNGIVEQSPNLINKYGVWYSSGATVEILENGDIKVISKAAGNYQYAYVLFDASKSQKFISQYELGEKTGDALFRVGYFENNTPTFKTAPTRIWNLENHQVGILALYVTVETSKPKGTYVTYKNVMVQNGMVDSDYSEYGTNVMRNFQTPCLNSIVKTIAHRGDFFLAPQCTAPAYIEARKRGITVAENDLNKTADGTYVMWHETTLIACGLLVDINGYEMYSDGSEFYYYDRENDKLYTFTTDYMESSVSVSSLTRCDGNNYEISQMNYSVLKRVDCGVYYGSQFKGTTILTFEEWVALCRTLGMDIYIDRKVAWTDEEAQTLVGIVKKYSMLDHATWFTGSVFLTECIRHYDTNARICLLTWPTAELMTEFSTLNTGRGIVFNGDIKSIDKTAIRLGLDNGFQVEGWYVDFWQLKTKAQAFEIIRDAVDAGCQAITTDHYRVDEAYGEQYAMYD